jgi:hypothetical protein
MRKFFVPVFFCIFVILILLVDWQEKIALLDGNKARQTLEKIWPFEAAEDSPADRDSTPTAQNHTVAGDSLPAESMPAITIPEILLDEPAILQDISSEPAAGQKTPAPSLDIAEQPYQEQSRQLLNKTVANYEKITGKKHPRQEQEQK